MKATDLKEQGVDELNATLIGLREEQFKLRISQTSGQLSNPHRIRELRRDIARTKTILNQKQGD